MGKGDMRTKRGKRIRGSYGNARMKSANKRTKPVVAVEAEAKPEADK